MSGEYRHGTPSFDEWRGLWKCSEQDSDVSDVEFYETYQSLDRLLAQNGTVGFGVDCDYYVLGDSYGDKTQDVEIVNPDALTIELLLNLQQWIREKYPSWRIVIPTFIDPHAIIIIYKYVIRFRNELESNLDSCLADVRNKMLLLDEYKHARKGGRANS